MLIFLQVNAFEIGAVVVGLVFCVFFALLLNPPTKWLNKWTSKK